MLELFCSKKTVLTNRFAVIFLFNLVRKKAPRQYARKIAQHNKVLNFNYTNSNLLRNRMLGAVLLGHPIESQSKCLYSLSFVRLVSFAAVFGRQATLLGVTQPSEGDYCSLGFSTYRWAIPKLRSELRRVSIPLQERSH